MKDIKEDGEVGSFILQDIDILVLVILEGFYGNLSDRKKVGKIFDGFLVIALDGLVIMIASVLVDDLMSVSILQYKPVEVVESALIVDLIIV